jgi:hypothetical protein
MPERRRSPEEVKRSMEAAKKVMAESNRKEREKNVRYGRNALLVVGILQVLVGLYEWQGPLGMIEAFMIDGGIGAAFIALYFYSKKEPVQSLTIGLIIYVAIMVLMAVLDPTSIFSGIIMKAIVISVLVSGLKSAKKLPKPKVTDDDLLDQLDDTI